MESMTSAINAMGLEELTRTIKITMRRSAKDAVQLGFMLRRVVEEKLYLKDYDDFDTYLQNELKMDYTLATRFININKKFSMHGKSMEIDRQYEEYTQGALIEMLSMSPEQRQQVTSDMTISQIREIKRQDREEKGMASDNQEDSQIPGQMKLEETATEISRTYEDNDELEPKDAELIRFLVRHAVDNNNVSCKDFEEGVNIFDRVLTSGVCDGIEYSLFVEKKEETELSEISEKPGYAEIALKEDMEHPFIFIHNDYLIRLIIRELREKRNMCCYNMDPCTYVEGSRLHRITYGQCPSNCCMSCENKQLCGEACNQARCSGTQEKKEEVATSQLLCEQVDTGFTEDFDGEDISKDAMEIITEIQEPEEPEILTVPVDLEDDGEEDIIEGNFREITQDEQVEEPAAAMENNENVYDERWFVKQYIKLKPDEASKVIEICRQDMCNSDKAKAIQECLAPYGCHCMGCAEYDFNFYGFSGGIDMRIGQEKMHMKYGRFVVELMRVIEQSDTQVSPYGFTKTVYREGSLINTTGCGHKHDCFSCAQNCSIRQQERYCVTAPLGNPYKCETMDNFEKLRDEVGESCQFVDNSRAFHTAGSHEAVPCCKDCLVPCAYICERAAAALKEQNEKCDSEVLPEDVLKTMKERLNDMLTTPERFSPKQIEQQKIIVAALASMVTDLELLKMKEELQKLEAVEQPELPKLKNNDSRKAWLENYQAWGLWYRDENIDINYYKYDFSDGSRLVVAEYPQRESYWSTKQDDEIRYHFLQKGKEKYGSNGTYDEKYRESPNGITELVEWLKNFQMGDKQENNMVETP